MDAIGVIPHSATNSPPNPTGHRWDAIRVPRYIGLAALTHLPAGDFPVLVDPVERAVYFLVPAGETDDWEMPDGRILVVTRHLLVPPIQRNMPPGRYWLAKPQRITRLKLLRKALEQVCSCTPH
ncbi:hypothetical protein AB0395_27390 [Streptosporangium sp. NPDC051023]|uniref:hypothetical protein n=1 Tax=Streptosporangium sp. NPDC051023 TaxID=3155410 RepID=UPI00344DE781